MIEAIILAAGVGTRLKPITDKTPKPMIEVGGKPVIGWVYENLKEHGIEDIIVNLHYLPLEIPRYLGQKVRYHFEEKLSGTAGILKILEKELSDPFIVVNGDTISNVDITEMLELHKERKAGITVFTLDTAIHNGGCFVFSKWILKAIPEGRPYSIHEDLIPRLKEGVVLCKPENIYYFDIADKEKLKKARDFFK